MLAGTLSGIEMGLAVASVPHRKGGVTAALQSLLETKTKAEPVMLGK
jgi:alanine-glyoxylate transaminase/serine-glyoxylate transaminase/serine-pyruvate transaminase